MDVFCDSPIDTAIIFGMDMSGQIAAHCAYLMANPDEASKNIFFHLLLTALIILDNLLVIHVASIYNPSVIDSYCFIKERS